MNPVLDLDILRHLPRKDFRKGPGEPMQRADKQLKLRQERINTYMGQLKAIPMGVSDAAVIKRIKAAEAPPLAAYIGY